MGAVSLYRPMVYWPTVNETFGPVEAMVINDLATGNAVITLFIFRPFAGRDQLGSCWNGASVGQTPREWPFLADITTSGLMTNDNTVARNHINLIFHFRNEFTRHRSVVALVVHRFVHKFYRLFVHFWHVDGKGAGHRNRTQFPKIPGACSHRRGEEAVQEGGYQSARALPSNQGGQFWRFRAKVEIFVVWRMSYCSFWPVLVYFRSFCILRAQNVKIELKVENFVVWRMSYCSFLVKFWNF